MPYAKWCKECIEQRARPDRHERTDGTKRGSIPEVSFDFCYTGAKDSENKTAQAVCWLVAIDNQTNYIHVLPLSSKGQFELIVQELMSFSQTLGYPAITYRSDNEPSTRQILQVLVNASKELGLTTRFNPTKIGDHSFLSENIVDRVCKLAGTFIEGLQSKSQFMGTSEATTREKHVGTYASSSASQLISLLTDGSQIVLSKCTDQGSKYRPIFKSFNAFSWEYQTNFGGRIIATKRKAETLRAGVSR